MNGLSLQFREIIFIILQVFRCLRDVVMGTSKLYSGRFDWEVAQRILEVIYRERGGARTNLAMKARVNYNTFLRYLRWMENVGWIDGVDGSYYITRCGADALRRVSKEQKGI